MRQENTHGLVARKLLSWGVALSPFLALKKQLQGAFELPVFFFFFAANWLSYWTTGVPLRPPRLPNLLNAERRMKVRP